MTPTMTSERSAVLCGVALSSSCVILLREEPFILVIKLSSAHGEPGAMPVNIKKKSLEQPANVYDDRLQPFLPIDMSRQLLSAQFPGYESGGGLVWAFKDSFAHPIVVRPFSDRYVRRRRRRRRSRSRKGQSSRGFGVIPSWLMQTEMPCSAAGEEQTAHEEIKDLTRRLRAQGRVRLQDGLTAISLQETPKCSCRRRAVQRPLLDHVWGIACFGLGMSSAGIHGGTLAQMAAKGPRRVHP
ncbi:hypothetical protein NM208_g16138 [Fusarium decemcellulare]|uniref:Uncharacterized protein n=1 Tax=Fusarium decemcellulare TaxID=57161 RepID=A0ACC1REE5_9HYPO|nr:hypothetical protein NM208_g16138 [Fusarium decemcellulare]